jgi:hypothetical protein
MTQENLFFDASKYTSNLRCTIQKTGKIGFSDFTQNKLGIKDGMSIRIGILGSKENYTNLLMQVLDTVSPDAFKINKAGNYYYINPKPLLDELNINYKRKSIIYDMLPYNEAQNIFKLIQKESTSEDTN